MRDLGIGICNDVSFHAHITKFAAKCRQPAGWILSTFRTRDQEVMLNLWKTFVFNCLDYWSQLWSPRSVMQTMLLEAIMHHGTKRIATVKQMNYWERLKELLLYLKDLKDLKT